MQAVQAWAFSRRPAVGCNRRSLRGLPVLVHEVSRRVWGLQHAGLNRESRLRLCPCCLPLDQQRRHPDLVFSKLDTQPTYSPVYASSYTSRCTTQNSGPSGSLLLPRNNFPFSASCRFIPAHWSLTLDWCGPKKCQNTYLSSRPERSEVEKSVVYVRNRRSLHSALLSLRCGKPQISPLRSLRSR